MDERLINGFFSGDDDGNTTAELAAGTTSASEDASGASDYFTTAPDSAAPGDEHFGTYPDGEDPDSRPLFTSAPEASDGGAGMLTTTAPGSESETTSAPETSETTSEATSEITAAEPAADDSEIMPETETAAETLAETTADTGAAQNTQSGGNDTLLITVIIVMGVLILGLIVLLIVKSVTAKRPRYTPLPIQVPPQMPPQGIRAQQIGRTQMPGQLNTVPATAPVPSPYKVGKLHEIGARGEQQDSFGVSDDELIPEYGLLAVVADGMGGLEDGGRVSAAATRSVLNSFLMTQGRLPSKELLVTLLKSAEDDVNDTLGEENYRKSGTTLVMGYFRGNEFNFLSIGDSRISLYRNGMLMQLNREHTYELKQLVRSVNGEMSISEALSDPKGAGLVNFLGKGEISAIDMPVTPIKLVEGDKIILMSDGVYNALTDDELAEALRAPTEQAALNVRSAVAAKNFSNQDNYTAVIIGYGV